MIREIATAFPERKIYLQLKPRFAKSDSGKAFIDSCQTGLVNVVYSTEGPMQLFAQASYVLTDPSTVLHEAIQFGLAAFVADVLTFQMESPYRQFEGLCVGSGDEVVDRIHRIESGDWVFPRDDYGPLVDLSANVYFDKVRKDIGLPILTDMKAA